MTWIGKSMLLFFMTLVYLYFHGTTVQGSSVGVSCRLFLLRLYFAQTHSSLAIAARPKSTKLGKNWSFIICGASKILCSVTCSHLILWSFFLTPWFCLFCECLKMTANHGYHSIYLISAGTQEDLFSSLPIWCGFEKGNVANAKTLELPLDTSVGADLSSVQS